MSLDCLVFVIVQKPWYKVIYVRGSFLDKWNVFMGQTSDTVVNTKNKTHPRENMSQAFVITGGSVDKISGAIQPEDKFEGQDVRI